MSDVEEKVGLKACPFCGGKADHHDIGNEHTKSRATKIWCTECFFKKQVGAIVHSLEWTRQKAIEAWNRRAPEDTTLAALQAKLVEKDADITAAVAAENERCAAACEARADYFDRAPGYRDWKDAARSYRATAKEIRTRPALTGESDAG